MARIEDIYFLCLQRGEGKTYYIYSLINTKEKIRPQAYHLMKMPPQTDTPRCHCSTTQAEESTNGSARPPSPAAISE